MSDSAIPRIAFALERVAHAMKTAEQHLRTDLTRLQTPQTWLTRAEELDHRIAEAQILGCIEGFVSAQLMVSGFLADYLRKQNAIVPAARRLPADPSPAEVRQEIADQQAAIAELEARYPGI